MSDAMCNLKVVQELIVVILLRALFSLLLFFVGTASIFMDRETGMKLFPLSLLQHTVLHTFEVPEIMKEYQSKMGLVSQSILA